MDIWNWFIDWGQWFFWGESLQFFNIENMISILSKDYFVKKMVLICQRPFMWPQEVFDHESHTS